MEGGGGVGRLHRKIHRARCSRLPNNWFDSSDLPRMVRIRGWMRVSATAIIELFQRGEGFCLSQWRVQFPGVLGI